MSKIDWRGWLKKFWSSLFFASVFAYMVFIFSKTSYRNFVINRKIYRLQKEVELAKEENLRLKNLVAYYRSDSYKERMARALLNYKKPEEKVIAFPYHAPEKEEFKFQEKPIDVRPNYKKWWDFLTGPS